ncbi:GNAT family N-acetyltransferase [Paenibacillus sambharensis]|uniref:GNAT family N-acetyltransferase n=2 Tax=Paenibacillus sambharensis TaxID=1803190 RepID=A0A2W1LPU7_9BACL|nr:GNAT family N-acetyltransferase [Paenibacillus sambharensis]
MTKDVLTASDRITLRRTEPDDLFQVLYIERDPAHTPFISQWTREQHIEALSDPDALHLIIEDADGSLAGYLIVNGLHDPNRSACLTRIALKAQGKGYGKEAIRLIVEWLFANTSVHRIWLDVKDFNLRARNVYRSSGFTVEGTLRDSVLRDDKYESLIIMSILRTEFRGLS